MVDDLPADASPVSNIRLIKNQLPSTDQMLALVTVARLGSFTKAAVELELSQPALSRQIIGLQRTLGVKLFERIGRSVRLTPAGEELCSRAAPLLEELSRVSSNLTSLSGSIAGRVRLGASESVAVNSLPANRRVQLRLVCHTSERLPDMVRSGKLDVAVCPIEYDGQHGAHESHDGLACTRLWDEELVLVLPINHPGRSRTITSYLNDEFILVMPGTETRRIIDRALAGRDAELRVVLEHESTEVIKAMVMAGLGLTILPEPNVRKEARRGELAVLPLSDLKVSRTICAIADARRQAWPAETALIEALQKYGR
jgi:LysR family transcriptional regulator, nitrogen assimilation regulatory protein